LPCRESEFSEVYSHLESAITDGSGACIYISGTPGTGKTATVREVVSQLNASVMAEELDDFIFVEINGMKVTDPHQSYSLLWEALKGDRVSPSQALDLLEREFNHPSPRRIPCVVLMDELDQLVTKNQSVMYNFFNWPGLRHSRLIVLAVANTMDLPERTLSNKISSRLGKLVNALYSLFTHNSTGLTRITFAGYNHEQLMKIIQSRLEGVPGGIVESDAIQFASRKVAAVSGDARRALDICRRAVELAETESSNSELVPGTPSKTKAMSNLGPQRSSMGKVTIATVKRAINEATTSPLQHHLRGLPLSSKLLLAALLAKFRRTGLGESFLGEIIEEAKRMAKMAVGVNLLQFLLAEISPNAVVNGKVQLAGLTRKTPRVYAMGTAAMELMEAGVIGLETRKGDRMGKIRLCIGEEDIKQALKDDPEVKGLGF
jgi:origin recognition complex subunit 1